MFLPPPTSFPAPDRLQCGVLAQGTETNVTVSKTPKEIERQKDLQKKIQWSLFDDNKNITKMRNCPEVPICNTLFVHGESHGLGLYLMVVHGVSHVVGHRASLETGLGVPHGVGHDRFIKCQEV